MASRLPLDACIQAVRATRTRPDKKGKDIRQMSSGEPILPGRLCLVVVGGRGDGRRGEITSRLIYRGGTRLLGAAGLARSLACCGQRPWAETRSTEKRCMRGDPEDAV